jgi:hypothetical protein
VAEEIFYGGRVHDLGGWARWSWGGSLTGELRIRSTYGAREFRSEQVQLSWSDLPLAGWRLSLRLGDSWSPWRQVEQGGLQVQGRWGRRWSLASGVSALLFRWETGRAPAWEMRFRPQLRLRFAPCRPLAWELVVEEQVDEFLHLAEVRRYRYESAACYQCHPRGRGEDAEGEED